MDCIFCRDTDEIHPHHPSAPAVGSDGRGYRIDAGEGDEAMSSSTAPLCSVCGYPQGISLRGGRTCECLYSAPTRLVWAPASEASRRAGGVFSEPPTPPYAMPAVSIAVTGLPLETQVANLVEHVRAQYGRIAALEAEVAGLRARERASGEA